MHLCYCYICVDKTAIVTTQHSKSNPSQYFWLCNANIVSVFKIIILTIQVPCWVFCPFFLPNMKCGLLWAHYAFYSCVTVPLLSDLITCHIALPRDPVSPEILGHVTRFSTERNKCNTHIPLESFHYSASSPFIFPTKLLLVLEFFKKIFSLNLLLFSSLPKVFPASHPPNEKNFLLFRKTTEQSQGSQWNVILQWKEKKKNLLSLPGLSFVANKITELNMSQNPMLSSLYLHSWYSWR